MLESIMSIFATPKPATEPPKPVVDPSKSNATIPGSQATSDGSVPAIPKAGEGDKSPLEKYKDIWDIDPKAVKPKTADALAIPIKADPAKLLETARGIDFLKTVNQDNLKKALEGDNAALIGVINEAAQAGYAQSALGTTNLIKAALSEQARVFKEEVMPEVLRRHDISRSTPADNQVLQSPTVKPLLSMVETQLANKNPGASADEISRTAREFITDFSQEILKANGMTVTPKTADGAAGGKNGAGGKSGETDWGAFFGADATS